MNSSYKSILLILFYLVLAAPTPASFAKVSQLGLAPGDIADAEADTLFVNPALGFHQEQNSLVVRNLTGGEDASGANCTAPQIDGIGCYELDYFATLFNATYTHIFDSKFGFFAGLTPLVTSYSYPNGNSAGIFTIDVHAGAWYKIMDNLSVGISATLYLPKIIETPSPDTQNSRTLFAFTIQPGVNYVLDKFDLGYSVLIHSDYTDLTNLGFALNDYPYQPLLDSRVNPSLPAMAGGFAPILSHILTARFPLNHEIFLTNKAVVMHDQTDANIILSSFANWDFDRFFFTAGAVYDLALTPYQAGGVNHTEGAHLLSLQAGIDIALFEWLSLRLGLQTPFFEMITYDDPAISSMASLDFLPSFSTGLKAAFDKNWDIEVTLNQRQLYLQSTGNAGFLLNVQGNLRF